MKRLIAGVALAVSLFAGGPAFAQATDQGGKPSASGPSEADAQEEARKIREGVRDAEAVGMTPSTVVDQSRTEPSTASPTPR